MDAEIELEQIVREQIEIMNNYNYKSVKYGNILAYYITEYLYNVKMEEIRYKTKVKWLIKSFYKLIEKYTYKHDIQSVDNKYVFSYFYPDRKDHLELFNKVFQQFSQVENQKITYDNFNKKFSIDRDFFRRIKKLKLLGLYKCIRRQNIYSAEFCLFLVAVIYQISYFIDEAKNIITKGKPQAYISFCDVHIYENIITQLMKAKGIKTFTLEHGIYFKYNKNIQNVNILAYVNFVSDYMLVWGDYTKKEMMKGNIPSEKLVIVGNPLYNMDYIEIDKKYDFFVIFLSQELYYESNLKMLEICNQFSERFNIKYKVKLHPSNKIGKYKEIINKEYCIEIYKDEIYAKELIKQGDFIILHSTTLYIDALFIGKKVFRYNDIYALPFNVANDKFETLTELIDLTEKSKRNNKKALEQYVKSSGLNTYRNVITDIVKKNYEYKVVYK